MTTMRGNMYLSDMTVGLLLRKEAFLDELLGNLDGVGCGSLAEVVGHAPEVEA